jgi:hypothetical protein
MELPVRTRSRACSTSVEKPIQLAANAVAASAPAPDRAAVRIFIGVLLYHFLSDARRSAFDPGQATTTAINGEHI